MMIKKSWMAAFAICAAFATQAQKVNVQSAYNELKNGSLAKAKEYIDAASVHPETNNWDKTFLYRGQIYMRVNADTVLKKTTSDALAIAGESFNKCKELDKKGKYQVEVTQGLADVYSLYIDGAIRASEKKNYDLASAGFVNATKFIPPFPKPEDNKSARIKLIDNAAYYAGLAKNYTVAIPLYTEMIASDSVKPFHYRDLAMMYKEQKNNADYLKTLESGIARFPGNYDLMVEEINAYIEMNKLPDAISKLLKAFELNPKNGSLAEVLGSAYEKANDPVNALKYYQKAIEINPQSHLANYNIGAMIVTEASKMQKEANKIPASETKKYDAAVVKINEKLNSAIPYLESAIASDKTDIDGMEALRKIYINLNQMDKASALKKQIDEAKRNKPVGR
jgi:tetratricopeptide (TPR) repeat protein